MASSDARATHRHDVFDFTPGQRARQIISESFGFQQRSLGRQSFRERQIACAWHMACHWVDRFFDAAKSFSTPRVEQECAGLEKLWQVITRNDPVVVHGRRQITRRLPVRRGRFKRQAVGLPRVESAIEYGDALVTEPTQQPPEPGRDRARGVVVYDNRGRIADSPCAESRREALGIREWMPAVAWARTSR